MRPRAIRRSRAAAALGRRRAARSRAFGRRGGRRRRWLPVAAPAAWPRRALRSAAHLVVAPATVGVVPGTIRIADPLHFDGIVVPVGPYQRLQFPVGFSRTPAFLPRGPTRGRASRGIAGARRPAARVSTGRSVLAATVLWRRARAGLVARAGPTHHITSPPEPATASTSSRHARAQGKTTASRSPRRAPAHIHTPPALKFWARATPDAPSGASGVQ